jgi:hypothetical protein
VTAAQIGKRLGIGVFATIVSAFTLVCTLQILRQVFYPGWTDAALPCRDAVRGLLAAVQRARAAAAASKGDERAALDQFRAALAPEWSARASLQQACHDDLTALRALKQVEQLRYAEEHAVRYEAVGLAGLRRKVRAIDKELHGEK